MSAEWIFCTIIISIAATLISPMATVAYGLEEVQDHRLKVIKYVAPFLVTTFIGIAAIGDFLILCYFFYRDQNMWHVVSVFSSIMALLIGWIISLPIAGVQIVLHPTIIAADRPTVTVKPRKF